MIRFLFDFISPYSYLAATQIRGLAAQHGREVEPVPVLFAGLLDLTGVARGALADVVVWLTSLSVSG